MYPLLRREGEHSTEVALSGFTHEEKETISALLQRVRKNVERDWEYVKKGNKRDY